MARRRSGSRRSAAAWTPRARSSIAPSSSPRRGASRGAASRRPRPRESWPAPARPCYRAGRRRHTEMTRTSVAVALAAILAAPLARAADPSAEAASSYRIDTTGSTGRLAPGAKGTLVLSIVPLAKVHVHPEAPLKIALEATPGLELAKTSLGKAD